MNPLTHFKKISILPLLITPLLVALTSPPVAPVARADAVTDWNAIAATSIMSTAGRPPHVAPLSLPRGDSDVYVTPGDQTGWHTHPGLTFEERVAYQRAIEEVYWRHRIWPKERSDPKPSLDVVMSQAQLEKKVAHYLRKSQALEDYWQRPLTTEQLQAEMDRMAEHTKRPDVLRELFEALGNDPLVVAECLARPALVEALLQSIQDSREANGEASQLTGSDNLDGTPFSGYTLPVIATGSDTEGTCIDDTWTATSLVGAPTARASHSAIWTGSEMIIWGGITVNPTNTGGRYKPGTDSWTATSTANAPAERYGHTAVWTGSEMIVWGGRDGSTELDTGGRYNPDTDSWTATTTTNAPAARWAHTAVWTGTEMIVWSGIGFVGYPNTGGKYNPNTDSWTATSTTNAPSGRFAHTAVWIGSEMIVWGGSVEDFEFNTGGRYNPGSNSWTATNTSNAPAARYAHTGVWTGSEMIVWGGTDDTNVLNTGGRYNPGTDSWTATSTANAPAGRYGHTEVWTGSEMIVWGGTESCNELNTGGRYDPGADSWMQRAP